MKQDNDFALAILILVSMALLIEGITLVIR